MLDFWSKGVDMASAVSDPIIECGNIVREAVKATGERTIKTALAIASQQLGLGFRRTKAYWNNEVRDVSAREADMLREKRRAVIEERRKRLTHELALIERQLTALGDLNEAFRERAVARRESRVDRGGMV